MTSKWNIQNFAEKIRNIWNPCFWVKKHCFWGFGVKNRGFWIFWIYGLFGICSIPNFPKITKKWRQNRIFIYTKNLFWLKFLLQHSSLSSVCRALLLGTYLVSYSINLTDLVAKKVPQTNIRLSNRIFYFCFLFVLIEKICTFLFY